MEESPGGHPPPVPALTGWTLIQAYHLVARRFRDVFAEVGLTAHQFGVLVQLDREPGISQAALARSVLITPQSMGELLGQLEVAGLVQRARPARSGVAARVELSAAGRVRLRTAYPRVAEISDPAQLGLTVEEADRLNALLHRVRRHLDPPVGGVE